MPPIAAILAVTILGLLVAIWILHAGLRDRDRELVRLRKLWAETFRQSGGSVHAILAAVESAKPPSVTVMEALDLARDQLDAEQVLRRALRRSSRT
jgi:uncharacterized tellurite resistance protein B-like protein